LDTLEGNVPCVGLSLHDHVLVVLDWGPIVWVLHMVDSCIFLLRELLLDDLLVRQTLQVYLRRGRHAVRRMEHLLIN